jgi:hypothetical protein
VDEREGVKDICKFCNRGLSCNPREHDHGNLEIVRQGPRIGRLCNKVMDLMYDACHGSATLLPFHENKDIQHFASQ